MKEKIIKYLEDWAVDNPIPRASAYAYAYLVNHNDNEYMLGVTFGVMAVEGFIALYKHNRREIEQLKKTLMDDGDT